MPGSEAPSLPDQNSAEMWLAHDGGFNVHRIHGLLPFRVCEAISNDADFFVAHLAAEVLVNRFEPLVSYCRDCISDAGRGRFINPAGIVGDVLVAEILVEVTADG